MKQRHLNIALIAIFVLLTASLSGCSWFRSGKKDGLSEADLNAQRDARYGEGGIPSAEGEGMFRDVHFDYDSSRIDDRARQSIEYNAEVLRTNRDLKIQLEGHCDERGTAEYNLALGNKRASSVKDVMLSYGIPATRLQTISYGEEVPLDSGRGEASWAKNRRVHFSAFK